MAYHVHTKQIAKALAVATASTLFVTLPGVASAAPEISVSIAGLNIASSPLVTKAPYVQALHSKENVTPAQISRAWSAQINQANAILLASDKQFADSFASGGLQGEYNAPLLLTNRNKLDKATASEILRLKATHVIVLGGQKAVSDSVIKQVESLGLTSERISGATRVETSLAISRHLARDNKHVYVINGAGDPERAYADALSVGSISAKTHAGVLVNVPSKEHPVHPEIIEFIKDNEISQVTVVGGRKAVSSEAFSALQKIVKTTRISGANRIDTSFELAKQYPDTKGVVLVDGFQKPDIGWVNGITASLSANKLSAPVVLAHTNIAENPEILVKPKQAGLIAYTGTFIKTSDTVKVAKKLGGNVAQFVPPEVVNKDEDVKKEPAKAPAVCSPSNFNEDGTCTVKKPASSQSSASKPVIPPEAIEEQHDVALDFTASPDQKTISFTILNVKKDTEYTLDFVKQTPAADKEVAADKTVEDISTASVETNTPASNAKTDGKKPADTTDGKEPGETTTGKDKSADNSIVVLPKVQRPAATVEGAYEPATSAALVGIRLNKINDTYINNGATSFTATQKGKATFEVTFNRDALAQELFVRVSGGKEVIVTPAMVVTTDEAEQGSNIGGATTDKMAPEVSGQIEEVSQDRKSIVVKGKRYFIDAPGNVFNDYGYEENAKPGKTLTLDTVTKYLSKGDWISTKAYNQRASGKPTTFNYYNRFPGEILSTTPSLNELVGSRSFHLVLNDTTPEQLPKREYAVPELAIINAYQNGHTFTDAVTFDGTTFREAGKPDYTPAKIFNDGPASETKALLDHDDAMILGNGSRLVEDGKTSSKISFTVSGGQNLIVAYHWNGNGAKGDYGPWKTISIDVAKPIKTDGTTFLDFKPVDPITGKELDASATSAEAFIVQFGHTIPVGRNQKIDPTKIHINVKDESEHTPNGKIHYGNIAQEKPKIYSVTQVQRAENGNGFVPATQDSDLLLIKTSPVHKKTEQKYKKPKETSTWNPDRIVRLSFETDALVLREEEEERVFLYGKILPDKLNYYWSTACSGQNAACGYLFKTPRPVPGQ